MGVMRMASLVAALAVAALLLVSVIPGKYPKRTEDGRLLVDLEMLVNSPLPAFFGPVEFALGLLPESWLSIKGEDVKGTALWLCGPGELWSHPYGKEAFEAVTHAFEVDNPPLTKLGRLSLKLNFVSWLCSQIQVNKLLKEHPEILDEPIDAVVIAGAPRTGSTHLLTMLCKHPNATCLTFMEAIAPIAPVSREKVLTWMDPRLYITSFASQQVQLQRPLFKYMFKFGAFQPMEELQLGAVAFGSSIFLTYTHLPTYDQWFKATDHTPMEEYVKLLLKVIQYQRGGERKKWVLKSPQNANQLGPVARTFPDASLVFTHREPVPVIQSMIGMLCYTAGVFSDVKELDYKAFTKLWIEHQRWSQVDMLEPSKVRRDVPDSKRLFHVRFNEFMKDPVGMALKVAEHAGLEPSEEARKLFEDYQKSSPQEGSKVLKYDLTSFGVTHEEINKAFEPYVKCCFRAALARLVI